MTLAVELLCSHHKVGDFDCGDKQSNLAVRGFANRVLERDTEEFHAVVVSDNDGIVLGITTTMDVLVNDFERSGLHVEGPCLFYTLLAVDKKWKRSAVVKRLLDEIDETRARRFSIRQDLVGEIACPDGGPASLIRYLEARGFSPLHNDRTTWYRLPPDTL